MSKQNGSSGVNDRRQMENNANWDDPLDRDDEQADEKPANKRQRARQRDYQPDYGSSPRKPSEERPNAFNALAWLLEGVGGLLEEVRHNDLGLPEDFWLHAYAARRESLLALRAVIDDLIEKSDTAQRQLQEKSKRGQRRGGIDIT
jgi:hypothetical protein